ncbi:excalibur calcium-binding domain-containing protein [uncultured Dietzia sp.]|uniref:excalibur calcium-binding domain-containing protein n=1 Tax=uncultured Dietzia sp. TaxID=395519 RepID=UPI0025CCDF35|nr:excalibur calcium-binding domain-containing protein [uncultured Dietzia sp.]
MTRPHGKTPSGPWRPATATAPGLVQSPTRSNGQGRASGQQGQKGQKTPIWKPTLAWVGVGIGVIGLLTSFIDTQGLSHVIGSVLMSLAFLMPGAWWLWCQHLDKQIAKDNATLSTSYEQMQQWLTPADAQYSAALNEVPQKPRVARRWLVMAPVAVAALIAGTTMLPAAVEAPAPGVDEGPTAGVEAGDPMGDAPAGDEAVVPAVAPAVDAPAIDEAVVSGGESREGQSVPRQRQRGGGYAPAPGAEDPVVPPAPVEAPAPAAAPVPAQAPVPAAAPVPQADTSTYFANCTEVRAAGLAPIPAGSPGYRAGLDRDNDGFACE